MDFLSVHEAYIFRITHFANIPWILANGLHCRSSATFDPNFTEIGRPEIIDRRKARIVNIPPGGTLSDYVPFYFSCKTPMLLNIKTGWQGLKQRSMNEIVILWSSLPHLTGLGVPFVFSDRTATLATTQFSVDLAQLHHLPWALWKTDNFKRDDSRPDKIERYLAETLVHKHLPLHGLRGIVCYSDAVKAQLEQMIKNAGVAMPVHRNEGWYC